MALLYIVLLILMGKLLVLMRRIGISKRVWKNNNLTYLVPYDEYIGYGVITDQHNTIGYYYLNFQDLIQVSKKVVNTLISSWILS